jgi:protoheme IX farnesyltransferase
MLPVVDPSGRRAGVQAVLAAGALLPVSLLPALAFPAAVYPGVSLYLAAALVLGMCQLACAVTFCTGLSDMTARRLLRASLIYLPALLLFLILIPLF